MYVDMNPLTLINMSATVSNIERISGSPEYLVISRIYM
jgi:hypothetical protein